MLHSILYIDNIINLFTIVISISESVSIECQILNVGKHLESCINFDYNTAFIIINPILERSAVLDERETSERQHHKHHVLQIIRN